MESIIFYSFSITYGFSGMAGTSRRSARISSRFRLLQLRLAAHGTPYVPSPLLYDGLLYFNQSNNAILSCLDAKSGEALIDRVRMPGMQRVYASPVAAAGRVYCAGRDGTTLVIERGPEFKVLAENTLDEGTDASPAIVDQQLFRRGRSQLYCIATQN